MNIIEYRYLKHCCVFFAQVSIVPTTTWCTRLPEAGRNAAAAAAAKPWSLWTTCGGASATTWMVTWKLRTAKSVTSSNPSWPCPTTRIARPLWKVQKNGAGNIGQVLKSILGPQEIFKEFIFFDFHGIHWMIHQFAVDGRPPPTTVAADRKGQDGEGLADNPLLKSRFMVKLSQHPPFLMVKPACFPICFDV